MDPIVRNRRLKMKKGTVLLLLMAVMLFGLIMVSYGTGADCSGALAGLGREADQPGSPGIYGPYEATQERQGELHHE